MVERAAAYNPDILRWARERSGLTVEEAAARIGKSRDDLLAWESGAGDIDAPTYVQLERLCDVAYKRPVALLFFPSPPDEEDPGTEFRTLSLEALQAVSADTRVAVREALRFRESLNELTGRKNPAPKVLFKDVAFSSVNDVDALAVRVRDFLGVSLAVQRSWRDPDVALKEWRASLESVGVFVFKRSFEDENVLGFSIWDDEFPLIMLNNSTAFSRQIFTLFHELAHICYHVPSMTFRDIQDLAFFVPEHRALETACNRFAGEFLLPTNAFPAADFSSGDLDENVRRVARDFSVSRVVVLVRLRQLNVITEAIYREKVELYQREWEQWRATRRPGGNYYLTAVSYLGRSFLSLAFTSHSAGRITNAELADHVRVKAQNLTALQDAFVGSR